MNEIFVALISCLGGVVTTAFAAYLYLQKSKDEILIRERNRSDLLIQRAEERFDKQLQDEKEEAILEKQELIQQKNDLIFITAIHYEKILKLLEKRTGISKHSLIKETKKINLKASEINQIKLPDEIKALMEESNGTKPTTPTTDKMEGSPNEI